MTRLWPAGTPIQVIADDQDWPQQFRWQGHIHTVQTINKHWRVDVGWWRTRIWRACYKLNTDRGLLVVIYQDLLSGTWYLERVFD